MRYSRDKRHCYRLMGQQARLEMNCSMPPPRIWKNISLLINKLQRLEGEREWLTADGLKVTGCVKGRCTYLIA